MKEIKSRYIIIDLPKEKIFKATRGGKKTYVQKNTDMVDKDFPETMQARSQWDNISK